MMNNCPMRIRLNVVAESYCVADEYESDVLTSYVLNGRIDSAYDFAKLILQRCQYEVQ